MLGQSLLHLSDAAMISFGFDGLMRRPYITAPKVPDDESGVQGAAHVILSRRKT